MAKSQDPEAAETVQTTSVPAVDLPRLVRLLAVAQPVMEAWAESHELDEWHYRCEFMIGTAYPRNLCPVCCVESSINWRDGKPYNYCPDHGELDDLYSEPNAKADSSAASALLAIINRIEGLVDWHTDAEADIEDASPEDMHAHCNGLVLQACKEARLLLANVKGDSQSPD